MLFSLTLYKFDRSLAVIDRLQCVQGCESSLQGRFTPLYALQAEGKIHTLVRTASDPGTIFHVNARAGTRQLFLPEHMF